MYSNWYEDGVAIHEISFYIFQVHDGSWRIKTDYQFANVGQYFKIESMGNFKVTRRRRRHVPDPIYSGALKKTYYHYRVVFDQEPEPCHREKWLRCKVRELPLILGKLRVGP